MAAFWLCFIPLFVAIDVIGVLPIFLGLTEGLKPATKRRIVWQSLLTALAVALIFLFAGDWIFGSLQITNADFLVAGGSLLFAISLRDLLSAEKGDRKVEPEGLGAVPLGVPLIVGPAVLTTLLLLAQEHGRTLTALAAVSNILIVGLAFREAKTIDRVLGRSGMRALSKVASLILAAIAVRMVRQGIMIFLVVTS